MTIKKGSSWSREACSASRSSSRSKFNFSSLTRAIYEKRSGGRSVKKERTIPIVAENIGEATASSFQSSNPPLDPKRRSLSTESSNENENHSQQLSQHGCNANNAIQADLRKCFRIPAKASNKKSHLPWRRNTTLGGIASKHWTRRVEAFQRQCMRKMGKTLSNIGFTSVVVDDKKMNLQTKQQARLDRILRSLKQPRYQQGQYVLVCHIPSTSVSHLGTRPSPLALSMNAKNLVNRHGYPQSQGTSVEERQGPYLYVLAEIRQVHCGDGLGWVQYTIERADSGEESWIDEVFIEPILSEEGRLAALQVAQQHKQQQQLLLLRSKETTSEANESSSGEASLTCILSAPARAEHRRMVSNDGIIAKCKTE